MVCTFTNSNSATDGVRAFVKKRGKEKREIEREREKKSEREKAETKTCPMESKNNSKNFSIIPRT